VNRLAAVINDAVLLLLLTVSIPIVILALGAPLALIIRIVVEILRSIF
jgi:hypothetical protein